MPVELMAVVAGAAALALLTVLIVARRSAHSKEREFLRELGFGSAEPLPKAFAQAMRHLHAPKAKPEAVGLKHSMRRQLRWGDLYHVTVQLPEGEGSSTLSTGRGFHGYEPRWRLPAVKILITKEPEGMMETAIVKALHAVVGKMEGRIALSGSGAFESRALVFGKSERELRSVLTPRLRQALLQRPYVMLEMEGSVFSLYRPAHAGNAKNTKEEWRSLMDTCRIVGEELAG